MGYSRLEQETSIVWDEEEKIAHIYTASPVIMRKLDKLAATCLEYTRDWVEQNGERITAARYTVPARLIRFGKPITRIMTDEQREAARKRMSNLRSEHR